MSEEKNRLRSFDFALATASLRRDDRRAVSVEGEEVVERFWLRGLRLNDLAIVLNGWALNLRGLGPGLEGSGLHLDLKSLPFFA